MSADQTHLQATSRLILCWHKIREGYAYANILSHHVIGALLKSAVVAYFIFCLLFLALRYVVLPHIDLYKTDIEQLATRAVGQPLSIGTLNASWEGLRPRLSLGNVVIRDKLGREALTLPTVSATLSWWSVILGTVRLQHLEIERPDMDIWRDAGGNLYVAGILVPTQASAESKGADWMLSQNEIVVRGGRVRWNDNQRGARELLLNDVNVTLRNRWLHHELALTATPPAALATPIDLTAVFVHPSFAARIADASRWKGALYADLHNTDLALWNAYVDYPSGVQVQQGHGSIRAWLDFDHAKVADLTVDLMLADTAVRFSKDLPTLSLQQVSGRVSLRETIDLHAEDRTSAFGEYGYSVALTNFSLRTTDGQVLPATTIGESYEPAKNGQPRKTSITATALDLQALANFAERFPLGEDQRRILTDFAPRGQLRNFSAQWQGDYPAIKTYDIKGQFVGLSVKAQAARPARPAVGALPALVALPMIPGFDNLTGQVAMSDRGGEIELAANQLKVELPGVFAEPFMPFNKLTMQADWRFKDKDKVLLQVGKLDVDQDGLAASFSGTDLMQLNQETGKSPGIVDITGHISEFDIKKIGRYLPLQTPDQLHNWLTGALVGGSARDVAVRLKGDLKDFPFHTETPTEKPKGEFTVFGKLVNCNLIYAPGNTLKGSNAPLWPLLEDIQGTIAFDRTRMEINGESAKTHRVALSAVKAVIADLVSPKNVLEIDGNAAGPLQEFVGYTKDSAVREMINGFTDDTRANGNAKLALKLRLPLADVNATKVQGKLQFINNDINLLAGIPSLTASTGILEFSEKGFNLNGIRANFLGGPVTVSGGGPSDAATIKAEGILTSEGLRKFAPPAMQRLTQRVTGSTRYKVSINIKKKWTDILVDSNLQGVALNFPVPLHKDANEILPARFELTGLAAKDETTSREEIKLSLGPSLAAHYEREKIAGPNAAWRLVRGGIGVNAPALEPDSGLRLNVSLKTLNVDAWLDLAASISSADKAREKGAPSDAASLSNYVSPDILTARATEFIIFGRKLDNVVLGATLHKDVWQANIESAQTSGYITYAANAGQGKGRATARLSSLIIQQAVASEVTELLGGKNTTNDIPALDIIADNFELLDKHMGRLELVANNVRTAGVNEWRINKLSVINPDSELKATGKWVTRNGDSLSSMVYTLDVVDAGRLLGRFGFANVLRGGKGKMNGELNWKGVPYSFDSPSLSGQLTLDMASGQFLKSNPGAAKLLGVLSLQSLPRRLTLDFRDVFSEGFAFDGITMSATITKGIVSTDNLKMRGLDATVLMDGSADINKETENLHIVIIPELDAGAASVVYGLAVNPVIGLGSFLGQLFLRVPLMKALTKEWQVTGSWKQPVYTSLRNSGDVHPSEPDSAIPAESEK
ncbi:MAG: YhdP family protein [Burkholderiales bacterium]